MTRRLVQGRLLRHSGRRKMFGGEPRARRAEVRIPMAAAMLRLRVGRVVSGVPGGGARSGGVGRIEFKLWPSKAIGVASKEIGRVVV